MAKRQEETQITIEDPILRNFYIKVDEKQYAVFRKTNSRFERMADGFFVSLEGALRYVGRQLLIQDNAGTKMKIEEYCQEYRTIIEMLTKKLL